jgi:hypothetical protein
MIEELGKRLKIKTLREEVQYTTLRHEVPSYLEGPKVCEKGKIRRRNTGLPRTMIP